MVTKKEREAYENGKKEKEYIDKNPIGYAVGGGIHGQPKKPTEAEAYKKGLRGEKLDGDKGKHKE